MLLANVADWSANTGAESVGTGAGAGTSLVTGVEAVVTGSETSIVTGAGLETLGTGGGTLGTGVEASLVTAGVGLDSGTGNSRDVSVMDPGKIEV